MREVNDGSVDDVPSTSEPDNSGMVAPPNKKAKGVIAKGGLMAL